MKLTKEIIKKLILEDYNNPNPNTGGGRIWSGAPAQQYIRNYKNGDAPDNQNKEPYQGRDPYETGPIETHITNGEIYVTQGKNQYKLIFTDENLTSGYLEPIGQFGFHIQSGMIEWHDQVPANVRNDTDLERQIMDYSGRED
jgi:hypothetical protein